MVIRNSYLTGLAIALSIFLCTASTEATIITYFPSSDIAGGSGLWASATGYVTTGTGFVEIALINTSPRQDNFEGSGNSANPWITEIEINLSTYAVDADASYVESTSSTLIAHGASNEVTLLGEQNLYYKIIASDYPGMHTCLMFGEADNNRNDNAIGSLSALVADIPQEYYATGFLNESPYLDSGAVFDIAVFHFELTTNDTIAESFFLSDNLVTKYQGGGDYSLHVENVPEPTTVVLLGLGALAVLRKRKR